VLSGGFRPKAEIATLRAYMRQRERLTTHDACRHPLRVALNTTTFAHCDAARAGVTTRLSHHR